MKALILSGGSGTRLRPLTYTHAKQLLPIGNKPIIFRIIEKIAKAGINDIGIIVGETHEEVKNTIGDGGRWNVNITFIKQSLPLGLGHAVRTASEFIGESDFLMVLGDIVFSMDLDIIIKDFYNKKADTSILLHKVKDASQFGVAVVNDYYVTGLAEKPKDYVSDLAIAGVYVFNRNIFQAIDNTKPSPRGELEITDAIQKQLEMGECVSYVLNPGWWKDTGNLQTMLEANRHVLEEIEGEIHSPVDYNSEYIGKIDISSNVIIKNCKITGPAVIGENSVITGSSIGPYASIGTGVRLNNCKIDNCIILDNTQIENIDKAISNSLIGKDVTICSSDKEQGSSLFLLGDNSRVFM